MNSCGAGLGGEAQWVWCIVAGLAGGQAGQEPAGKRPQCCITVYPSKTPGEAQSGGKGYCQETPSPSLLPHVKMAWLLPHLPPDPLSFPFSSIFYLIPADRQCLKLAMHQTCLGTQMPSFQELSLASNLTFKHRCTGQRCITSNPETSQGAKVREDRRKLAGPFL